MKHIIFCFPGAPTVHAAESWDDLRSAFASRPDLRMSINRGASSSVMHLRNQLLEVGVTGPKKHAKPFGGLDYDFMMWIDSDSVYRPEDFFRLLELDADIASGIVPINFEPGRMAAGKIDVEKGITAYRQFDQLPREPWEEEWCGFAFLLVKRGVFEAIDYPWFDSVCYEIGDHFLHPGEDIRWCLRVREKGFKILLHSGVRIGHEKLFILEAPAAVLGNSFDQFIERYDRAWRMSAPALQAIKELLDKVKPSKVLELGPGASSFVILPWCMEHRALYRALDHSGPYAEQHLENLRQADLATDGTYIIPLKPPNSGWYAKIPAEIDAKAPYDLVIVDGPIEGRACPAALAAYIRWGHHETAWVFDDVNRQEEREAMAHVAKASMRMKIIRDPDFPRQTCILIPGHLDEQGKAGDTVTQRDAEAVGPTASKGQPEAIA